MNTHKTIQLSSPENPLPKPLTTWLQQWLSTQSGSEQVVIELLAGDGSVRCFYRVKLSTQSFILLSDPGWVFSKDYPVHQHYLADCDIPVPRFFAVSPEVGGLIMEDLGDELLQFRLLATPGLKMSWLEEAARLLARLHGNTYPVPSGLPVSTRRFDKQKYFDEMLFTFEHLSKNLLGLPPPNSGELEALGRFCESIAAIGPDVFCHRDYHTRNILVAKEELFLIDFQDARLGSPHYDLASLLYDAYVPVSDEQRRDLIAIYKDELESFPLVDQISWEKFEEDLAGVALQRVVKAAGSFASFFTRYGKKTHLPYLLPALESAQALMNQHPNLKKATESIFKMETWLPPVSKLNV